MKKRSLLALTFIFLVASLPVRAAEDVFSNPPKSVKRLAIDSKHCITKEKHFWVRGGQITVNPSQKDVFDVRNFQSPPYSGKMQVKVLLDGKQVPVKSYEWRPGEVVREGRSGDLAVTTLLTPVVDRRGVLLTARVTNEGKEAVDVPLRVMVEGGLDYSKVLRFSPAKGKARLDLLRNPSGVPNRRILLRNKNGVVAVASDMRPKLKLEPGKSVELHLVLAVGRGAEATMAADAILLDPDKQIAAARRFWDEQIEEVYKHLPRLSSDNQKLVDFYDRGMLSIPQARWEMPGFILSPYYTTSGIDGGAFCCYIWDLSYGSRLHPLVDPETIKKHWVQELKSKPMEHYAFSPLDGTPIGPHYSYNQYSIIRAIYYYVVLTGDVAFLDEKVDGKTILEHVIQQATYGDDVTKPVQLIDYGTNRNLLELKLTKAYEGVVPSPNGERCWSYRAADELAKLAGKPSPGLSKRADALAELLVKELWSDSLGWFQTRDKEGKKHTCYSVQVFDLLRLDILDKEKQEAILKHLNDKEFLSKYGVHSLSKQDPGYDLKDVDWGGPGVYTGDAPELVCDLYHSGHPEQAGDLLRRILWWGQTMPYYPQAVHADQIEYRQNGRANLQNGASAVEGVLFGVVGLDVTPEGVVSVKPYLPPETKWLELKGIHVRGKEFDVKVTADEFTVTTKSGKTLTGKLGQKVVVE